MQEEDEEDEEEEEGEEEGKEGSGQEGQQGQDPSPSLPPALPRGNMFCVEDHSRSLRVGDLVREAQLHIPEPLVRSAPLGSLSAAADAIPIYPFAGVVLEIRGADADSQVDLSLASVVVPNQRLNTTGLAEFMVRDGKAEALVGGSKAWAGLKALSARLLTVPDKAAIWDDIWLEFDRKEGAGLEPSVFLGPADMYVEDLNDAGTPWSVVRVRFMVEVAQVFKALTGEILPPAAFTMGSRIVSAIPRGGELHQVGFWTGRPDAPKAVRWIVMLPDLKPVDTIPVIGGFLALFKHTAVQEIISTLRVVAPLVDKIILSVDAWETLHGKVGFELYIEKRSKNKWIWQRFMDLAKALTTELQVIGPDKMAVFKAFLGFERNSTTSPFDRGIWNSTTLTPPVQLSRTVNHFKIVYDPAAEQNKRWTSKIYLWITEIAKK